MPGSSRSMREAVESSGRRHSRIARKVSPTREDPSSRKGRVDSGPRRLRPVRTGSLLHQRATRRAPDDCSGNSTPSPTPVRAGRRHLGRTARQLPQGRRDVDRRQLRSGSQPDVLGYRAGQAVDARQPRHDGEGCRALHELHRRAQRGRWEAGVALPALHPENPSTSMKCTSACSWTSASRRSLFTIGKAGILWKIDRRTGAYLGHQ